MKPTILLRRIPNLAPFNNARLSSGLSNYQKFWKWTTQTRPSWKESKKEAAVLFVVFGVTGSASVALVRPALKDLIGLEGSFVDGPNSYRVLSILLVSPMYAVVLFTLVSLSSGMVIKLSHF